MLPFDCIISISSRGKAEKTQLDCFRRPPLHRAAALFASCARERERGLRAKETGEGNCNSSANSHPTPRIRIRIRVGLKRKRQTQKKEGSSSTISIEKKSPSFTCGLVAQSLRSNAGPYAASGKNVCSHGAQAVCIRACSSGDGLVNAKERFACTECEA